tara:strand:+ start:31089 stop:33668 length:2580 start_codon:yes stop_codon:yes gene_type:complete
MASLTEQLKIQLLVGGTGPAKGQLKGVGAAANATSASFARMAVQAAAAMGGIFALTKAIGGSVSVWKEFGKQSSKARAILGETEAQMKPLVEQAKLLGSTTRWTASQISELQVELAKLGFLNRQIQDMTHGIQALAAVADTDLANAASVAGGVIRAFGLQASESTMISNLLAKSFASTALDITKFTDSIKYVGPVANQLGISVNDTTAMLGHLANNMIDGSMAGTSLRKILLNVGNSSSKLVKRIGFIPKSGADVIKAFKQLGKEGLSVAEMEELVGVRAVSAFSLLLKGGPVLEELSGQFNDLSNEAAEMQTVMMDNLAGDTIKLTSAMEGLGIRIGELSDNFLRDMTQMMTKLFQSIDLELLKSFGLALKVTAAGLTAFAVVSGGATAALKALTLAMLANPVTALAVGLTVATTALIKFSGAFKESSGEVYDSTKNFNNLSETLDGLGLKTDGQNKAIREQIDLMREQSKQSGILLQSREQLLASLTGMQLKNKEAVSQEINLEKLKQSELYKTIDAQINSVEDSITFQNMAVNMQKSAVEKRKKIEKDFLDTELKIKAARQQGDEKLANALKAINKDRINDINDLIATEATARGIKKAADELQIEEQEKAEDEAYTNWKERFDAKHATELEKLEADRARMMEQAQMEIDDAQNLANAKYLIQEEFNKKLKALKDKEEKIKKAAKDAEEKELKHTRDLARKSQDQQLGFLSKFKGMQKTVARMRQAQAISDMYAGANKALADYSMPMGGIVAAGIIAQGLTNVMNISQSIGEMQNAATGMDQIVTGPTAIMTGEAGAERVQVTPLMGENQEGPQGGGDNINVSVTINAAQANEEIVDLVSEAVMDGIRKGKIDMGSA